MTVQPVGLWRIALSVPEHLADRLARVVEPYCLAVSTFEMEESGPWLVEGTAAGEPDRERLKLKLALAAAAEGIDEPFVAIDPLPPVDWLRASYEGFPPIRAGRFFVHGSHYRQPPPAGLVPLMIDAATAFGSGEHATTRGCLLALDRLARRAGVCRRPGRILDMGCGTGILAIAAAKLWRVPVIASDIDPEATRMARLNARLNEVAAFVRATGGAGYAAPPVRAGGLYDLILANILARPLARLAPDLRCHLAQGRFAVLSGLLERQVPLALEAHRKQGMLLVARIPIDGWPTLVMQRSPGRNGGEQ